ncbi:Retrovirus-related Pol polyprotein from transposon TNT 1-94 [Vitis vinifera]|uniref:Retrovirus-related Pol polyprotein from transposon TNT 1-94 n=1 Tax=Vitis vinifera TaxID=29760 RepID=A0A438HET9_VITVI|nr:Retrovirus-related Pol polyprotein from transposon TNT 1-94 [Vitis vinifera]
MDVKIAFLNVDLEEEIYMEQPEGCVVPRKEKKSVYNKYEDNTCLVTCLYVDDMLIFGTSLEVVCETKKFLGSKSDMKDLGDTEVIPGIKITRTPNGLKLSQEHYVEKILRKFEHFDCKLVSTPYDPSSQLDIAYAVGRLSRYTQSPNQDHWTVVRRVLKYLRGTINYGLCYSGFPSVLEGLSDANWISDLDEIKFTSVHVFILGANAVSWKSAKKTCITRFIMKAELIALKRQVLRLSGLETS